jgi:hypothetical protein
MKEAPLTESKLRILRACTGFKDNASLFSLLQLYVDADLEGGTMDTFNWVLRQRVVLVPGANHKCNMHVTPKILSAVKILNFLASNEWTFVRCSNGITPFCTPWQLADAVDSDMADKHYFQEATLKSLADVKKFAMGAKFDPPQTLNGLIRIFTKYIRLLEVLFGNQFHYLQWVLQLRDGLDLHDCSLESCITPPLMINLLWQVHQDAQQFFNAREKWDDSKPLH